jgi:hypothetical protein
MKDTVDQYTEAIIKRSDQEEHMFQDLYQKQMYDLQIELKEIQKKVGRIEAALTF